MKKIFLLAASFVMLLFFSCKKEIATAPPPVLALLSTIAVSNVSFSTATAGGTVTSDGNAAVTARGVCWSIAQNPGITDSKTIDGTGAGSFASALTGLLPNTFYYLRAYATNSIGTAYGNEISFTTGITSATLTTNAASNITFTTAVCGGDITASGGGGIITRGICWNTSPAPTIANNKQASGSGIGSFTANLTSLAPNTNYYARAYVTTSFGTAYGNEISFTTQAVPSNAVLIGTQVWMNSNLNVSTYRNGDPIPQVTDSTQWITLTTGAWCYYANQTANGPVYGKLYNWYAVNDPRGLAPAGWHIPVLQNFYDLMNFLSQPLAGGKLKEAGLAHWDSPNTGANNSTGFTGVGSGFRSYYDGAFVNFNKTANIWSASEYDATSAHLMLLTYFENPANTMIYFKNSGYAVRCVKD